MWTWRLLKSAGAKAGAHGASTYVMEVPSGYVLRTVHEARPGRGPDYAEHPSPYSEALVFVPHVKAAYDLFVPGEEAEGAPPCE